MRAGHDDRRRQARKITLSQLVFGVAALSGCAQPPDTQVEADWIATMARYNMVGLYPIGEDLQPGDVLLHLPSEVGPQPTLRRIGSLDRELLLNTMQTQEERRLRVQVGSPLALRPQAPPAAAGGTTSTLTAANTPGGKPPASGGGPRLLKHHVLAADGGFGDDDPVQPRMKRLAMPSIGAARVTEGQIAGAGPLGTGGLAGALGFGRRVAVLIRLKDAEMLGVDEALAHAQLGTARVRWIKDHLSPRFLLDVVSGNAPSVVKRICAGEKAPEDRALLRVVNRVLYAHSIEYEFLRGNAVAGALAAELARTAAAGTAGGVSTLPATAPASTGVPAGSASGAAAAAAGLASVQQELASGVPPRPGITTRFGIGTFGNAAVTEVSQQPLAVAYVPLASYSVRGSLLVTSDNDTSAERQMREAVGACDAALDDEGDEARRAPYLAARAAVQRAEEDRRTGRQPDPRSRTPIEDLLCNNTRDLLWQNPGLADAPRQTATGKAGVASKTDDGVGLFLPKRCTDPAIAPSAGLHVAGESTKVFPYRPGR